MTDELTLKYVIQFLQLDASSTVQIKQMIQEEIDKLKSEQIDTNNTIKVTVYERNKQLITTAIETEKFNYEINNDIFATNQKVTLIKKSTDGNSTNTIVTIERNTTDNKNSLKIEQISKNGETIIDRKDLTIDLNGNVDTGNLELNIKLENVIGNRSNEINYNDKKEFDSSVDIEDFTSDNYVMLNDMSSDELKSLYKSIIDRIQYLYDEKLQNIGFDVNTINYQASLKWSRIVKDFEYENFKISKIQ